MIEWVELHRLLGAERIVVYVYTMHHNTQRVLQHYSPFVQVRRISLPGAAPNNDTMARTRYIWRNRQQKRRNELMPYNDCVYSHLATHDWALIVDTDEVVVPLVHANWSHMLNEIANEMDPTQDKLTSLSVRNVFKFDSLTKNFNATLPDTVHMLRHRWEE